VLGLGLLFACSKANPAYRIEAAGPDAAEEPPPADAAVVPDLSPSADVAPNLPPPGDAPGEDLAAPEDTAAPADLTPDLALDSGVSSAGLVAHWRLDERSGTTAADATGNGNTGTTKGGATWVSGGFPAARFANAGALLLDGEDDYVEIAIKTIPANTAPKTVSVWFKATAATALPIRNLLALINDGTDVGIQLGLDHGRVAAWFYGSPTPLVAASASVDESWHHAAYTFDGVSHRIYYDGRPGTPVDEPPKPGTMNHVRLGTYQVPDEMFAGTIDDVRLYARALSDAEVSALWMGQ
jgi:hypothetical protein